MSGRSNEADWLSPRVRATGTERSLDAGETLFRSGQRTTGLYEILNGRVKLVRVDRSGRETVLYNAGAGSTLAEASLFSPAYHCDAIATTAAAVRLYRKDAVLQELRRSPDAAEAFIAGLARQVMSLTHPACETQHTFRARSRLAFSCSQCKRRWADDHIAGEPQGARGRAWAHPRGTLPNACADGRQRRDRAPRRKDQVIAPHMIEIICVCCGPGYGMQHGG